jgi:hypothetical protein
MWHEEACGGMVAELLLFPPAWLRGKTALRIAFKVIE